ncbi:hypothetical protein D3C73_1130410 [compost metagenome]
MTPEAFTWQRCPECRQGNGHAEPGNKQIENKVFQTQLDIADGAEAAGSGIGHLRAVYVKIGQRQVADGQIADQLTRTFIALGI